MDSSTINTLEVTVKKWASLILTVIRQPPVSMVGLNVKVMFSPSGLSREVWLALMDRGVADTSWNTKHFIILKCFNSCHNDITVHVISVLLCWLNFTFNRRTVLTMYSGLKAKICCTTLVLISAQVVAKSLYKEKWHSLDTFTASTIYINMLKVLFKIILNWTFLTK